MDVMTENDIYAYSIEKATKTRPQKCINGYIEIKNFCSKYS